MDFTKEMWQNHTYKVRNNEGKYGRDDGPYLPNARCSCSGCAPFWVEYDKPDVRRFKRGEKIRKAEQEAASAFMEYERLKEIVDDLVKEDPDLWED